MSNISKSDEIVISIHQPNYLPYLGFFLKMSLSDIFILLDNVQYSKDSYTQRTKIRTKDGWMWLTIPINRRYSFTDITEVCLPKDDKWKDKHKRSIIANYSRSNSFDTAMINDIYNVSCDKLSDFNEKGIYEIKSKLGIKTKVIRSSDLDIHFTSNPSKNIIKIIESFGGKTYIAGMGGKNYLDIELFKNNNIAVKYLNASKIQYKQRWSGFFPNMSSIDFLFNVKEKADWDALISDVSYFE